MHTNTKLRFTALVMIIAFVFIQAGPGISTVFALRPNQVAGQSSAADAIGRALGAVGSVNNGIEQCSGIMLDRDPDVPTVDIASFVIIDIKSGMPDGESIFQTDSAKSDRLTDLQEYDFASFKKMTDEMRDILIKIQPEKAEYFNELKSNEIIQEFNKFASMKMRNFILEMAIVYNLDMHTEVILQWGSGKLAHYYLVPINNVPGAHRHVLALDIAAFIDSALLEAETLHEILHPRVNPWLNNMHVDLPELIKAIPEATVPLPKGNPPDGYYALASTAERPEAFKDLAAALSEVFILLREIEYIDRQNAKKKVAETLESTKSLDKGSRFAKLLEVSRPDRIKAVLDFISDKSYPVPANYAKIVRGSEFLQRLDDKLLLKIIEYLHGRLDACLCEYLPVTATTLDEAAELIERKGVEEIELFLDDTEGHLKGQEKSILLLVNESTPGILRNGAGVDLSSFKSSITNESLMPITHSDGIAYPDPSTFRIIRLSVNGRCRAVMSAQVRKPFETEPPPLKNVYHFNPTKFIKISRGHDEQQARHAVRVMIEWAQRKKSRTLGKQVKIDKVKLFLNDFSGNTHIVEAPVNQLQKYLEEGVPLTAEQTQYFPTTGNKSDLVARLDPYSLRIVEYGDDDEEIEALMHVWIEHKDGNPYEGDFRAKLAQTANNAKEKGRVINASAEPEFYLFKKLSDGRLVTSDNLGYYSSISNLPFAVQNTFHSLTRAMETAGILARYVHPEVGPGQFEIPIEYQGILEFADSLAFYKYIVPKSASKNGLVASFLPKPVAGEAGSGMHIHISESDKSGNNLFYDPDAEYYLSDFAHSFIAGILKYSNSTLAIISPACNSALRITPDSEAPCDLAVTIQGRSGAIRIPAFPGGGSNAPAARLENRIPSPLGNPYAQLWAVAEAGIEGTKEALPRQKITIESLYRMSQVEKDAEGIEQLPGRNDFFGIDGPMALKQAKALMLADPAHPFVAEVIARIQQAELIDEQIPLFKERYDITEPIDAHVRAIFATMKKQIIERFEKAVGIGADVQDRRNFIESRLPPEVILFFASAAEPQTAYMEHNSLFGPAIVSQAASFAAANGIENVIEQIRRVTDAINAAEKINFRDGSEGINIEKISKQSGIELGAIMEIMHDLGFKQRYEPGLPHAAYVIDNEAMARRQKAEQRTVLVIDDEPQRRDFTVEMLIRVGFNFNSITTVDNLQAAKGTYDLVVNNTGSDRNDIAEVLGISDIAGMQLLQGLGSLNEQEAKDAIRKWLDTQV